MQVGVRMKPNEHYMDYTGSSVYCQSQIEKARAHALAACIGGTRGVQPLLQPGPSHSSRAASTAQQTAH